MSNYITIDPLTTSDIGVAVNNADTTLGSNPGTIEVLPGNGAINTQISLSPKRRLKFGMGTFTTTLTVPVIKYDSYCTIEGDGWGTILKEPASTAWAVIASKAWVTNNYNDGETDVTIRNLQFAGNNSAFSSTLSTINIANSHRVLIENCFLNGTKAIGIQIGGGSNNGYFAEDVIVANCHFKNVASQNIGATNARRFQIINNDLRDAGQSGGPGASYIDLEANTSTDLLQDFLVSGNVIHSYGSANNGNGILVQHSNRDNCGPGTISNNVIWGQNNNGNSTMANAFYLNYCEGVKITGNTVRRIGQMAYQVYNSKHCDITNNLFELVGGGGLNAGKLYGSTYCQIMGNTLHYPSGGGSASSIFEEGSSSDFNTYAFNWFSNSQDNSGPVDGGIGGTGFGANSVTCRNISNRYEFSLAPKHKIVQIVTASRAVSLIDDVILVDTTGGAVTLTLPDATYGARELTIRRKAGTANITVTPYGTQKINGASSLTISDDLATPLQSDWSNWWTLR